MLFAGAEAGEQSGAEDIALDSFFDSSSNRPATFARIRDASGEFAQLRIFGQGGSSQIEQPGADHAASAPNLCHVGQVDIVGQVWVHERSGFGIVFLGFGGDIGVGQDVEALGKSSHDAIFNAVVDHFDKVARA